MANWIDNLMNTYVTVEEMVCYSCANIVSDFVFGTLFDYVYEKYRKDYLWFRTS